MTRLALFALIPALAAACTNDDSQDRSAGQTHFVSAPPNFWYGEGEGGGLTNGAGGGIPTAPIAGPASGTTRAVEETDLYRVEGNRLYYLNSYRGLMVFDVTDVDHPSLLGRSPIYGTPVDMVVNNGIAIVVVADWYGTLDDGSPFHGSIVRGLDATDPTNIKPLGDARLGGWVQDDRVVGNVIYAVSEDYGWDYGWGNDNGTDTESVIVSSVSFANNTIQSVGKVEFPGYSGIFSVTPNSIMLAHDIVSASDNDTGKTGLLYLDISDPNGAIVQRGSLTVDGMVEGWGADNGRWNLDFADGLTAHVIGCGGTDYCDDQSGFVLSTADFSNPDHPQLMSAFDIAASGWSAAARFDTNRLYLSPQTGYDDGTGTTPFQVYDLTKPAAPFLAGTVTVPGDVWNILPAPSSRIFALGDGGNTNSSDGESVSLTYLDVTNPAAPTVLGTSQFGQGWAWTPAAGTFKAFTMDATQGLVVLPFSGWDPDQSVYTNGLQLIQFTLNSETTAAAARTKGWVERGIFVGNRLVSLSDTALAVVDYSNPDAPTVVTELTLARNVVASRPTGASVAELSSDWWDNDVTSSELRMLPIGNADETTDSSSVPSTTIPGVDAQVFNNGNFTYVVTNVQTPCTSSTDPCRAEQVQVIDLSSGLPVPRGTIRLPMDPWGWYGWGWFGFYWYDWFTGAEIVQVGGDALAFRRWEPTYDANGNFVSTNTLLYLVDLSSPDAPTIASTTIQPDPQAWWGNMQVVGNTIYTGHYDWVQQPSNGSQGLVAYYLDALDLSDRSHPRVGAKINVPGMLVGADASDSNILYTVDYRWDGTTEKNDFNAVSIDGDVATLLSTTRVSGWTGRTIVHGATAYVSAQRYPDPNAPDAVPVVDLHAIDLSNPSQPVDRVASGEHGWGWLLDVEGDRALVTSGWGPDGLDVYTLAADAAPTFSQTVRTRGWWINGVSRQDSQLFLSSGYWGVQTVDLQ